MRVYILDDLSWSGRPSSRHDRMLALRLADTTGPLFATQ
jgi:hypothetical protein